MSRATAAMELPVEPRYVMVPIREKNGLGTAGFVIAFVGLFIPTGLIALLGLLVSLVALGRSPRGLAALGVVTGLFGTVLWLGIVAVVTVGAVAGAAVLLLACAGAFILTHPEVVEVSADMANVGLAAVDYHEKEGRMPQDLGALGLSVSTATDPWGNPYRYELVDQDPGFDVYSAGGDGAFGTADDLAMSGLGGTWKEAMESFDERVEDLAKRFKSLEHRSARHGRALVSRYEDQARREVAAAGPETPVPGAAPDPEAAAPGVLASPGGPAPPADLP